jgi:porin
VTLGGQILGLSAAFIIVITAATLTLAADKPPVQASQKEQVLEKQKTRQAEQKGEAKEEEPQEIEQKQKTKSGYVDIPLFGGPSSVGAELQEEDQVKVPLFRFPAIDRALKPWFNLKERVNRKLGLQFGLNYNALYQVVTESPGKDQAASGIFEFLGTWTLLGRNTGHPGTLVFKLEQRHRLGTLITPVMLGLEAGSILPTGTKFNDFGLGLTNLYWQQRLLDGRLALIAGRVDPTDYVDIYGLINPLTAFQNLAFLSNPTIAFPDQGLGAALGAFVTEKLYVVAGFCDANGKSFRTGFDTFFKEGEYFKHVELGWTPSFKRRYLDNIHITAWQVDKRQKAQTPEGWGLAVSATKFINDKWMPFLRVGWANGKAALLKGVVSAGIGWYFGKSKDLLGFGLSWGRPSEDGLRDQYTGELFYRFQLTQNIAITPDVQLIINPALNPTEDVIGVFGLRGRLTF